MITEKGIFYNLTGDVKVIKELESIVKEMVTAGIHGTFYIPKYAHNQGNLVMNSFICLVSSNQIKDLYDFVDGHNYKIGIEAISPSKLNYHIHRNYMEGLSYDF